MTIEERLAAIESEIARAEEREKLGGTAIRAAAALPELRWLTRRLREAMGLLAKAPCTCDPRSSHCGGDNHVSQCCYERARKWVEGK